MNIKWLFAVATLILLVSIVALVWSLSDDYVMYPPGPKVWYRRHENIAALVFLLLTTVVAGRCWYWFPAFFFFGFFLVLPPAAAIGLRQSGPQDASFGSFLLWVLPVLLPCCVAGALAAWLGSQPFDRVHTSRGA